LKNTGSDRLEISTGAKDYGEKSLQLSTKISPQRKNGKCENFHFFSLVLNDMSCSTRLPLTKWVWCNYRMNCCLRPIDVQQNFVRLLIFD